MTARTGFIHRLCAFAAMTLLSAALFAACAEADAPQHQRIIDMSVELLQKMALEGDAPAFADAIKSSRGVAIFPSLVQAGLGIGGMHGEGIVLFRNAKGGWTGPSYVSLVGGSFGLQIGIKQVGLVLTINNDDGKRVFTGGKSFKLGGDASIAAGPLGRDAEAATDSRAQASLYSYSMSRGAFAGLTISGSTVNVNGDANQAYWGSDIEPKAALSKPANNKKVAKLVAELNKLIKSVK